MNCRPIASFLVVCKNNRPQCAAGHKTDRIVCSANDLAPTVHLPHCNFDTRAKDHTLTKGSYSSAVALLREPKKRDSCSCNLEIHATYRYMVGAKTLVEHIFRTALCPSTHWCILFLHTTKNEAMGWQFMKVCRVQ